MILLDSDVMIDLLRQYPHKREQERLQGAVTPYGTVWLAPADCDRALAVFTQYHLSHNAGVLDVLIGQTAVALGIPLHTFNQKHYQFMTELQTI